jgi:hypothetical protein
MYYEDYNIDLHFGRRDVVKNYGISFTQGDTAAYKFIVHIIDYDGYEEEAAFWTEEAFITIVKPDGTSTVGECDITRLNEGIIIYEVKDQDTTAFGSCLASIQLIKAPNIDTGDPGTRLTSQTFQYSVVEDLWDDTAVASTNELSILLARKSTYIATQNTPAITWTLTHSLDKYPSVTVVDSAGSVVYGDIQYISRDVIEVTFSGAFSGTAYLN